MARMSARRLTREFDRAEDARAITQRRRDDVGSSDVLSEQIAYAGAKEWEEHGLLRDTSAEDDPLRRQRRDHVDEAERQILRLECPGRCIVIHLRGRAPSRPHRLPGGEPFEAIAMERAYAVERVAVA